MTHTLQWKIDPTNPGQFFACCGLLELADRACGGAEGWFVEEAPLFRLATPGGESALSILQKFADCPFESSMSAADQARLAELSALKKKAREADAKLEEEKKRLDALRREAPLLLGAPFELRLDWFIDDQAGGAMLKTWAGQQSVCDIAAGMQSAVKAFDWSSLPVDDWLSARVGSEGLPFNFDAELGARGSDLDVGFSFDPLKIKLQTRPLIEALAFVGLQRFRPFRFPKENRYRFWQWHDPLPPEVAAAAASGAARPRRARVFEFRLLYRTTYLKSFLPANPLEDNS